MSISSQGSLHLCLPHDQNGMPNDLNCFPTDYSTLESASMTDRSEMSFAPDTFSTSPFTSPQHSRFEPALDLSPFPIDREEHSVGYTKASDDTADLPKVITDFSSCFQANDTPVYDFQGLRQPQITYSPYQPQGYYIHDNMLTGDTRRFQTPMMFNYGQLTTVSDSPSPCPTSPTLEHSPVGWPSPDARKREGMRSSSPYLPRYDEDDDESLCDKPYARLIYEALMQAPGHRMMLREIYEWFLRNTTKPKESGTNGWQNSIRHNLSMNQAFENDKSDLSTRGGHVRKSNSVWILTDYAVRNGVQSTTRYRKTGNSKKTNLNRVPAVQRQRSGAKGGQAARRAAKLRRREQADKRTQISPMLDSPSISSYSYGEPYACATESDYLSACTPATPPDDRLFGLSNVLPLASYSAELPSLKMEDGFGVQSGQNTHGPGVQTSSDECIDDLLRLHHEPR